MPTPVADQEVEAEGEVPTENAVPAPQGDQQLLYYANANTKHFVYKLLFHLAKHNLPSVSLSRRAGS